VLTALNVLFKHVVKLPDADTPLSSRISNDGRFTLYFDNCISALDGTYIHAFPRTVVQAPFRNCKGFLSYNILAVCTFDLQFCYVYLG
jgi:hypothetical protein